MKFLRKHKVLRYQRPQTTRPYKDVDSSTDHISDKISKRATPDRITRFGLDTLPEPCIADDAAAGFVVTI